METKEAIEKGMLIVVVGKSGAGKSELIKAMNCPAYKSSDRIKEEVRRRGMLVSHESCQVVADDLYGKDPYWQVPFILNSVNGSLVLDGVRKGGEVQRLFEVCPRSFVLAVEASPDIRFERLQLRDGITKAQFEQIEKDESERTDLPQLLGMGEIVVRNEGSIERLGKKAEEIALLIKGKGDSK